jgi:hypothetical protein
MDSDDNAPVITTFCQVDMHDTAGFQFSPVPVDRGLTGIDEL